jgi:O-antigen/teichoic acid export membrane protein
LSISKHTAYNLVGAVLPLGVTLLTVPLYLDVVGLERYGVLTVCWVLLGFLGFLDLGLGPAVSQRIASTRIEDSDGAEAIFWTAIWLSLGAGLMAAALFCAAALLYFEWGGLTSSFRSEIKDAIPLLATILPLVMMSSVAGGVLHGRERFFALNLINMTSQTLMAILPLLLAYFWMPTLGGLVAGALAARAIGLALQFWSCRRAIAFSSLTGPRRALIAPLLKFGGWVTISTAAAPFLVTLDRLVIGFLLGAAAVGAYAIPFSLVSRMSIIPASLSSALFPRFASGADSERRRLLALALSAIAVTMTPTAIAAILIVGPFFNLWIGADLAGLSTPVAYFLIFGAWSNSLAHVPLYLLQGSGRPDIVSKIHLAEILPYWGALTVGLLLFGLPGAAMAWALRTTADCGLLFWQARVASASLRILLVPALLLVAAITSGLSLNDPWRYPVLALLFLGSVVWSFITMPDALRLNIKTLAASLPWNRLRTRTDL